MRKISSNKIRVGDWFVASKYKGSKIASILMIKEVLSVEPYLNGIYLKVKYPVQNNSFHEEGPLYSKEVFVLSKKEIIKIKKYLIMAEI